MYVLAYLQKEQLPMRVAKSRKSNGEVGQVTSLVSGHVGEFSAET